jgi:hypothetical protein
MVDTASEWVPLSIVGMTLVSGGVYRMSCVGQRPLGQHAGASLGRGGGREAEHGLHRGRHLPQAEGVGEDARGEVGHLTVADGLLQDDAAPMRRVGQRVAEGQRGEVDPVGVIEAALQEREKLRLQEGVGVARVDEGLDGAVHRRARQEVGPRPARHRRHPREMCRDTENSDEPWMPPRLTP